MIMPIHHSKSMLCSFCDILPLFRVYLSHIGYKNLRFYDKMPNLDRFLIFIVTDSAIATVPTVGYYIGTVGFTSVAKFQPDLLDLGISYLGFLK